MRRASLSALAALTAALVLTTAALAKDGDVRVRGTCTAGSTAKLKLGDEDGRIEVELEVDQNRSGVRWTIAISRNGVVVARAKAVTNRRSGSFEVRRVIADRPGSDRVSGVATSPTGERCTASATI